MASHFEIAQHAILSDEKRTPTVEEVIQEHIDLLIRFSLIVEGMGGAV